MMKKSSISSGSYAVLTRPDVVIDAIQWPPTFRVVVFTCTRC